MKKILLTFVAACLMGTTAVNAQKWGGQFIVRGGFATNNFKGEHTRGIDMLPSYNIGVCSSVASARFGTKDLPGQ